jgi:hypothetical protein
MIKRFLFVPSVLALALILAGCGSQKGKTVFTAGPDSGDNVGTAPETGEYALYTSMSANPTRIEKLNQGDKLGFRKSADGRIEAVWKDQTYDFDKGTAQVYWKLQ